MTRQPRFFARGFGKMAAFCVLLLTVMPAGLAWSGTDPGATPGSANEQRRSRSVQFPAGRSHPPTTTTNDTYPALARQGSRSADRTSNLTGKPSGGSLALQSTSEDFWIYYADVRLFDDDDEDGHYHGIDLLFDADTVFEEADVYAVLYLSLEGGPWNEYAVTDTFRIWGATSDDEYVVVTELETGYPRGNYDLVLDLYDTFDGRLVATLGPEDTSAFSYLPLEDMVRDDPHRGDVVVVDGGGAVDPWTVLAGLMYVLAVWLVRRRQRRCE